MSTLPLPLVSPSGKPWTYKLEIKRAADLPVFCDLAYVEYEFFGETFTTEAVQQTTYSPVFDYTKVTSLPASFFHLCLTLYLITIPSC